MARWFWCAGTLTESYEEEQRQQERLMSALFDARHANQEKNEFLERMVSRDPDADEFHHRPYVSDQGICEQ